MYFEDLTSYSYYQKKPIEKVKNVGWLDQTKTFSTGKVTGKFLEKLRNLIACVNKTNVHVNPIRGIHPCNLCGEDLIKIEGKDRPIFLGSSEIWIPYREDYFAAPSMILHYIEEHNYIPPPEFIESVMEFDMEYPFNGQSVYDGLLMN
jgi:hypothetical protein